MASYKVDESVAVAFTAEPKPSTTKIRTLPTITGGYARANPHSTGPVSAEAQQRLDLLSLQQSIVNLQTAVTRQR
jgi:hypothetical protein